MNTLRTFLIFTATLLAFAAYSQPVLTPRIHGIAAGLSDRVQAVSYASPGASGAGQHWDFRSLQATGLPVTTIVSVDALGRLAMHEGNGVSFYFEPSGNANLYKGFESPGKIVVYDRSITKLRLQFAYGNHFTEAYTANGLFIADTIATRLEGTYTVTADAYGSLVLPDGRTFEQVLRVKTIDRYREHVCDTTETLLEKYLWYTPAHPLPVFTTVQAVSGFAGATARDTLRIAYYALVPETDGQPGAGNTDTTAAAENAEPTITLFPNPASTFIEVHSEVDLLQYQLRNVSGILYKSQKVSPQEKPLRIPLVNTTPGWYVLNLETANGWLVRRFVIQ